MVFILSELDLIIKTYFPEHFGLRNIFSNDVKYKHLYELIGTRT